MGVSKWHLAGRRWSPLHDYCNNSQEEISKNFNKLLKENYDCDGIELLGDTDTRRICTHSQSCFRGPPTEYCKSILKRTTVVSEGEGQRFLL